MIYFMLAVLCWYAAFMLIKRLGSDPVAIVPVTVLFWLGIIFVLAGITG